jgi:hypothetical protein
MKKQNLMNLAQMRKALATLKGNPAQVIKQGYALAEGDKDLIKSLISKKQALSDMESICKKYNVGAQKVVQLKNGGTRSYTIKFSFDMVVRYSADLNKTAKVTTKPAKSNKGGKDNKGGKK